MSYYRICPHCGAALDPGERCDCREGTESEPRANPRKLTPTTTREYKKTAPVLEHRDGQKQNHNHMIPPSFYRAEEGEVKYENGRF